MALLGISTPLSSSSLSFLPITKPSSLSSSSLASAAAAARTRTTSTSTSSSCFVSFAPLVSRSGNSLNLRGVRQVVRMAPDEETMTEYSPFDFPCEWEQGSPARRGNYIPQFSPPRYPLPSPVPEEDPDEEGEDEEDEDEYEEE